MRIIYLVLALLVVSYAEAKDFKITTFDAKPVKTTDGSYKSEFVIKHNGHKVTTNIKKLEGRGIVEGNTIEQVGSGYNFLMLTAKDEKGAVDTAYLSYFHPKMQEKFMDLYTNEKTWNELCHLDSWNIKADQIYKTPIFGYVKFDEKLPKVLLIGNSISMGYTLTVRRNLAGIANVCRIPENGGDSYNGLAKMKLWLGEVDWDVIHLCFGLHDLKYTHGFDRQNVPPVQYEKNLREILSYLTKKTKAKIILALTTYYPEGSKPRRDVPDAKIYNDIALRVASEFKNIAIDDHFSITSGGEAIQYPKNVHFLQQGNVILGGSTSKAIKKNL